MKCFSVGAILLAAALTQSAYGGSGKPSVITYQDSGGQQRIYAFVTGANSHLFVNYWDGGTWRWNDQGLPSGAAAVYSPSAITFTDAAGIRKIYVFGTSNAGHLVANVWSGSVWNWKDYGTPSGASVSCPSVVNFAGLIYAFARTSSNQLVVNYGSEDSRAWANQGVPRPGSFVVSCPSSVAYTDTYGTQQIHTFAVDSDGKLADNNFGASGWRWTDLNLPYGSARLDGIAPVVFPLTATTQNVSVFATDNRGFLFQTDISGHWIYQGSAVDYPSVVSYTDTDSTTRIYAFERSSSGHLVVNYSTGRAWLWNDQGLPGGAAAINQPSAITYRDAGVQRQYVFATADNGHLVLNYWDGGAWAWVDQGFQ